MGFFLGLSLRGEKRNDKIKGQTGKNCRAENAGDSYDRFIYLLQQCRPGLCISRGRSAGNCRFLLLTSGMAMRLLRLQAVHKYMYKTRQKFRDKLYTAKEINPAKE